MTIKSILPEQLIHILDSLSFLSPEIFLGTAFLFLIILELFLYKYIYENAENNDVESKNKYQNTLFSITAISVLIALNQVFQTYNVADELLLFGGMLVLDAKAIFFKIIIILSVLLMLAHIAVTKRKYAGEFYPLVISLLIGLNLMTMSINLLMIYLSIEIVSIASYVLTSFNKTKKFH